MTGEEDKGWDDEGRHDKRGKEAKKADEMGGESQEESKGGCRENDGGGGEGGALTCQKCAAFVKIVYKSPDPALPVRHSTPYLHRLLLEAQARALSDSPGYQGLTTTIP